MIWAIDPAHGGTLWCGTIPGGLFGSEDRGDSWSLVRSLWEIDERRQWMGAGMDYAGIHSICVDPQDANHLTVGVVTEASGRSSCTTSIGRGRAGTSGIASTG